MTAKVSADHVRQHANSVAHTIARFALHFGGNYTWFDGPPFICDHLEENLCHPLYFLAYFGFWMKYIAFYQKEKKRKEKDNQSIV